MEVTQAHTVRIGSVHKCSVFEADGFVYATILGDDVPGPPASSRSRPSAAYCETKATGNMISTKKAGEVRGEGSLLGIFADSTDDGVVLPNKRAQHGKLQERDTSAGKYSMAYTHRRDQHEPPLAHFVDALCTQHTKPRVSTTTVRMSVGLGSCAAAYSRQDCQQCSPAVKRKTQRVRHVCTLKGQREWHWAGGARISWRTRRL